MTRDEFRLIVFLLVATTISYIMGYVAGCVDTRRNANALDDSRRATAPAQGHDAAPETALAGHSEPRED